MYDTLQVDSARRVIRPTSTEGDDFFGLSSHVYGTGPTARREAVTPPGYKWVRHDGRPAIGLCYRVRGEE